ncbi:helix-turn-helix transcriptional regulator [Pseudonocardia saturnea]
MRPRSTRSRRGEHVRDQVWYLVAYDPAREDWRTFRVDRITDPEPVRLRFTPREPPTDAATMVRRAITAAPARFTAVATVAASAAEVERRLPMLLPGRVTPVDEARCTVRLAADDPARLLGDLVALDAPFTLDADEDVRAAVREAARRLAAAG